MDTRRCSFCNSPVNIKDNFCKQCGKRIIIEEASKLDKVPKEKCCDNCGAKIEENHRFCKECGKRIVHEGAIKLDKAPKVKYCNDCGARLDVFFLYCKNCGKRGDTPEKKGYEKLKPQKTMDFFRIEEVPKKQTPKIRKAKKTSIGCPFCGSKESKDVVFCQICGYINKKNKINKINTNL